MFTGKHVQEPLCKNLSIISVQDIHAILSREFGPRYLEYRKQWDATMRLETVPEFPLSLELETQNYCNLRCNMCAFASKTIHPDVRENSPKRQLPLDMFYRMVDEGADYGLPAMTYGAFSEPLLHPGIVAMTDYAFKKGVMDQRIGTNGMLLTPELSRQLIEARLARLEVSVDAFTEQTYNKIRPGGNFQKVLRHIEAFLELREKLGSRIPLLRISFVKLNVNIHELEPFMEYWRDYADYFSIQEPIDWGLDANTSEVRFEQPHDKREFRCDKQFQRLFIRHNGNIMSCGHIHFWTEQTLGNLNRDSLKALWDDPRQQALRELHRRGGYPEKRECRLCVQRTAVKES